MSRMLSPGQIAVGPAVRALSHDDDGFEFRPLGEHSFAADGLSRTSFEATPLQVRNPARLRGIFVGSTRELKVLNTL
ncbi:MAG: hypothetical protein AB7N70_20310 [Dehalococcoidia bacterium]